MRVVRSRQCLEFLARVRPIGSYKLTFRPPRVYQENLRITSTGTGYVPIGYTVVSVSNATLKHRIVQTVYGDNRAIPFFSLLVLASNYR